MKTVILPTIEIVKLACEKFDREEKDIENALRYLFSLVPANTDPAHVLLKVAALNAMYSTHILAFRRMSQHICEMGAQVDASLESGDAAIVEKIGNLIMGDGEAAKEHHHYCFATKYCNWHQPAKFPIWDSRVDFYVYNLQRQHPFSNRLKKHDDLYDYANFRSVIDDLRREFRLEGFSYKDLDKFMYTYGEAYEAPSTAGIAVAEA
jgi:hypothetical protein